MNLITKQKILHIQNISPNKNQNRHWIEWTRILIRDQYANSYVFGFSVKESDKYKRSWLNKNLC